MFCGARLIGMKRNGSMMKSREDASLFGLDGHRPASTDIPAVYACVTIAVQIGMRRKGSGAVMVQSCEVASEPAV